MSITHNNETIKLLEHRTLVQNTVDAEAGRREISTYNIDVLLNNHIGNLFCRKDFLQMLYPYLLLHMIKPIYRGKKVIFTICIEAKTRENIKASTVQFIVSKTEETDPPSSFARYLHREIDSLPDTPLDRPIQDVKLVIYANEVRFLNRVIRDSKIETNINERETFKNEQCVVCLQKPPNVLFCNCEHLSVCSDCFPGLRENKCVVCKTENITIRIL